MYVGKELARDEDVRFLLGKGSYVDDMSLPNMAHAAILRSPHAHARLLAIDTDVAARMPGVLAVLTIAEWKAAGLGILPCVHHIAFDDGRPMNEWIRPVFAEGKVCFVGDQVACVIAETYAQALDACEAVVVDYDPLPPCVETARALDTDAPILNERFGSNVIHDNRHGDREQTEAAFASADLVAELDIRNSRVAGLPMEPRVYLGHYDRGRNHYTLWATAQMPHFVRRLLSRDTLFIPEHKLRVVAPDVGGGFGPKGFLYPEQPVVLWASKLVGRPVKWVSTRSEALLTDTHGRDHVSTARMAFDSDGRVLGLWCDTIACLGAYHSTTAASIPAKYYPTTMTGMYRTPTAAVHVRSVHTNTAPVAAYRGSGRPEATLINELLFENGARQLGIDPAEMRVRNYISKDAYPYTNPLGRTYESGDPLGMHEKLMQLSRYEDLRQEQMRLRTTGVRLGIGMAAFVETSGSGPTSRSAAIGSKMPTFEVATLRVYPDGTVTILAGTHSHGQSHEITFRQIAADALGIDIGLIDLVEGDTDRIPVGSGTWGSRSVSTAGVAIAEAGNRVIGKATKFAAHLLECAEKDILYEDSMFKAQGTNRMVPFAEVALLACTGGDYPREMELGLEETVFFDPIDINNPTAIHLAVVIVDEQTGRVRLRDYYAVDDCGRIINPTVVEGQVHGGLAQGIGQALLENMIYDHGSGQLLTGTFMDYGMPRASDLPSFAVDFQETLNPHNALGVKGGSETGAIGPPAAIGNAIVDALWNLGVRYVSMPYTPEHVWTAIAAARGGH